MTSAERLKDFIAEMLQWEVTFDEQRRAKKGKQDSSLHEQTSQEARKRLWLIFTGHLSIKRLLRERKLGLIC